MKGTTHVESVIRRHVEEDVWRWLTEKAAALNREKTDALLREIFSLIPRKTGTRIVRDEAAVEPPISIDGWPADRLCRVWLIMQLDPANKDEYLEE